MPIRHCQLCGIKVIVDEDKASVFPFYCDLCQTKTNMKSSAPEPPMPMGDEMGMPMAPSFDELTAAPEPVAPPPPPPPPMAPRITTTRQPTVPPPAPQVKCPVCMGEIPVTPASRPIKSRCPICNADLAIYPDGSVKSANEAELLKYAKTQEINVRPPTEDLKTKIREMIAEEQKTRMTPQPAPPPPRPVAKPVIPQGPKIVIKGPPTPQTPAAASQTGTRIALKPPTVKLTVPPPPPPPPPVAAAPTSTNLTPKPRSGMTGKISVPPPPPPPPPPSAPPDEPGPGLVLIETEEPSAPMPEAPMEPPIADDLAGKPMDFPDPANEEPAASTQATKSSMSPESDEASSGLLPASKGTQRRTGGDLPKPKSRRMPFVVVLIVLLIAPAAGAYVYFQRQDESLRKNLNDLGQEIAKTGQLVWTKVFAPAPEKPVDPNVAPPISKKEKKTEEELGYLKSEIAVDYDNYLKDILKTYKKSDMSILDSELSRVKTQSVRIQNSINQYKNMSGGKEPDLKTEFKKSLETFLVDLYQFVQSADQNARKLTSDVATPMIQRINRAKDDFNKFLAEFESTYNAPVLVDDVMDKKLKLVKMDPTPMPNPDADLLQRLNKAYQEFAESEKEFKKKGQMATEFERMLFEHNKKQYEDLKAEYEKKTGKTYEPPK